MKNIAIFGVPRSGTSWLGQIFNSSPQVAYRYQPIFAYSFKRGLSELSSSEDIQTFHRELLCLDDDFVCQKRNISGNPAPQFTKKEITHLVWKEVRHLNVIENLIRKSSTKVIGIIRHPCGVLKSWMQAPREFKADWDVQEEWRFASKKNDGAHDFYGYERWLSAANMFLRLAEVYPGQFRILIYESLLRDSKSTVKGLFEFVDLILCDQVISFIEESTTTISNDPYDVFRMKKSGTDWEEELPGNIIASIVTDHRFDAVVKGLKIKHPNFLWK